MTSSQPMSGKSADTACAVRRKRPSDFFMMFDLWTIVTRFRPFARAYSNANRAMRSQADCVVTLTAS